MYRLESGRGKGQAVVAREQREENGDGKYEEDDGDHHRDLLAPTGFEQCTLAGLPRINGLRTEDVGERGAAFDRDDHAVNEPAELGHSRPRGNTVERLGQGGTGARLGESTLQFERELPVAVASNSVESTHRRLTCSHRQRKHLRDSRELHRDAALAFANFPGEPLVAAEDAAESTDDGEQQDWAGCRRGVARAEGETDDEPAQRPGGSPDDFFSAELVDGHSPAGSFEATAHRRTATEQCVEST